jgi:hypothetical protein
MIFNLFFRIAGFYEILIIFVAHIIKIPSVKTRFLLGYFNLSPFGENKIFQDKKILRL